MNTALEILRSVVALFVDDAFLTIAILVVVAATAALISVGVQPLFGGGFLLLGNLIVLSASTMRAEQRK